MIPALSRSTVLAAVRLLPYGRPGGGTGGPFFQHPLQIRNCWPLALPVMIMLATDAWMAVGMVIATALLAAALLLYYRIKINCITGDMLGAMIEVTESGLFLMLAAFGRIL
jgi:adenosylcobinamide-GDP ribazoletransferase